MGWNGRKQGVSCDAIPELCRLHLQTAAAKTTAQLFVICEEQLWGEIWSWYLNILTILNLFSKLSCAEWVIYQWAIWKGTYLNPFLSPRCASLAKANHTQRLEENLNSRCTILIDAFTKIRPNFSTLFFCSSRDVWNSYSLFLRGNSLKMQLKGCPFLLCHSSLMPMLISKERGSLWESELNPNCLMPECFPCVLFINTERQWSTVRGSTDSSTGSTGSTTEVVADGSEGQSSSFPFSALGVQLLAWGRCSSFHGALRVRACSTDSPSQRKLLSLGKLGLPRQEPRSVFSSSLPCYPLK